MTHRYKTIFRYIGGKGNLTKYINEYLPKHICCVDAFGGSGAFTLNKLPSPYEVYNDLDDRVYMFFKVLREQPEVLQQFLTYTPVSRKQFEVWKTVDWRTLSEVEQAARFYHLINLSFSANIGGLNGELRGGGKEYFAVKGGFATRSGYRKDGSYRNIGAAASYKQKVDYLHIFAERFRSVVIEHLHVRDLIPKYDYEMAFFYCDPPYLDKNYYGPKYTRKDHKKLSEIAHELKGKIMLSYYPHPLVEKLYPRDVWYYIEIETQKQLARGYTNDHDATELLIMNYDPTQDKWRGRGQTAIDQFFN